MFNERTAFGTSEKHLSPLAKLWWSCGTIGFSVSFRISAIYTYYRHHRHQHEHIKHIDSKRTVHWTPKTPGSVPLLSISISSMDPNLPHILHPFFSSLLFSVRFQWTRLWLWFLPFYVILNFFFFLALHLDTIQIDSNSFLYFSSERQLCCTAHKKTIKFYFYVTQSFCQCISNFRFFIVCDLNCSNFSNQFPRHFSM